MEGAGADSERRRPASAFWFYLRTLVVRFINLANEIINNDVGDGGRKRQIIRDRNRLD